MNLKSAIAITTILVFGHMLSPASLLKTQQTLNKEYVEQKFTIK
ncbi:hypothetical protein C942_03524 [Photobacterium marinum]|uniref:Uncharacterized protein n=1 Tax=Photobacterium marinum TaxID=1056511 RepID=L8J5M4_9GAMM|nr:hypothetical protein C942_03524 [Photobacterium marinum]